MKSRMKSPIKTCKNLVAPLLSSAGVPWSYLELDSDKGHFASGADAAMWSGTLRGFMDTPPDAWVPWGLRR